MATPSDKMLPTELQGQGEISRYGKEALGFCEFCGRKCQQNQKDKKTKMFLANFK